MVATQTRRKRRVGKYLRELRERSGRKTEEAADLLGVKRPTITRMESGETLCRRTELGALCAFYGATDAERAEALSRWEDAKQDTTRVVVPGAAPRQLRSFLRAEADAASEKIISPIVINGLLQTADYATAVTQAPSGYRLPDVEIERMVDARISRQGLISGKDPLTVHAIMDEAVVRRAVGGPEIMAEQLKHLLRLAEQPHITLQVVPFEAGAYGTMSGAATILEFPDAEDPPAAYVEYAGGGSWVEDKGDVAKLITTFDVVKGAALTSADTANLFRHQIEAWTHD